MFSERTAQVWC